MKPQILETNYWEKNTRFSSNFENNINVVFFPSGIQKIIQHTDMNNFFVVKFVPRKFFLN